MKAVGRRLAGVCLKVGRMISRVARLMEPAALTLNKYEKVIRPNELSKPA